MIRFVSFRSGRRRHPLARAGLAVIGVVLLGLFSIVALAFGSLVLGLWLARRYWLRLRGPQPAPPAQRGDGVIEGEYRVIEAKLGRPVSR